MALPTEQELRERIIPELERANLPLWKQGTVPSVGVAQLLLSDWPGLAGLPHSDFAPYEKYASAVSREQWLEALESSQYPQVSGALIGGLGVPNRTNIELCKIAPTCCIGVAPKLLGLPVAASVQSVDPRTSLRTVVTDDAATLIEGMCEYEVRLAIELNDTAHYTFAQIATVFRILWNIPRKDVPCS